MFLSVIIPLYNKEMFISKTLQSIVEQNFDKCEIIVVDDCSNDNSLNKARNFTTIYPEANILIYQNKENSGVSYTRNQGLLFSTGEYVLFLDADDEISNKNLFEEIYQITHSVDTDYIFLTRDYFGKFLKPEYKRVKNDVSRVSDQVFKIKNKQKFIIGGNFPLGGSASAILSRKLIMNSKFDEKERLFEDWLFFGELFVKSKKSVYYSKSSIKINNDVNSLTSITKIDRSTIPKFYYIMKEYKEFSLVRKYFFWQWLKNSISKESSLSTNILQLKIYSNEIYKNMDLNINIISIQFIMVKKVIKSANKK